MQPREANSEHLDSRANDLQLTFSAPENTDDRAVNGDMRADVRSQSQQDQAQEGAAEADGERGGGGERDGDGADEGKVRSKSRSHDTESIEHTRLRHTMLSKDGPRSPRGLERRIKFVLSEPMIAKIDTDQSIRLLQNNDVVEWYISRLVHEQRAGR